MRTFILFVGIFLILPFNVSSHLQKNAIATSEVLKFLKTVQAVIFGCSYKDTLYLVSQLLSYKVYVELIDVNSNFNFDHVLSHITYARTSVVIDCKCNATQNIVWRASNGFFFNKTYNWVLLDENDICVHKLFFNSQINYFGPNAQLIQIRFVDFSYTVSDCHSKGRHLNAPLEIVPIARITVESNDMVQFIFLNDIFQVQSLLYRDKFNGVVLRGAAVIDQDNIASNSEIENILSRRNKDAGVAAFSKYHFELLNIIRNRFNFTVNFRNTRGWAGRSKNSSVRLGFLGIMKRNEADIGASAAFNRINRFSEFDTIHQSWKFETAFLYKFTPDLRKQNSRGNFLAPFQLYVWLSSVAIFVLLNSAWMCIEYIRRQLLTNNGEFNISLNMIGVICQQGLDPAPKETPSRIICFTTLIFSFVFYNFYTSSVVVGLLNNKAEGPTSVEELTNSNLHVSFEDIGYYKILFRENKSYRILRLLEKKVLLLRQPLDLPVYAHIKDAVEYIRQGRFAFHCEVVDAYPEIAKQFDVAEICDLRVVSGLMDSELMNWVLPKNSQYTEIFRIIMARAMETGLVERLLDERMPKKPPCRGMFMVYSVELSGISSALGLISGGILASIACVILEIVSRKKCTH